MQSTSASNNTSAFLSGLSEQIKHQPNYETLTTSNNKQEPETNLPQRLENSDVMQIFGSQSQSYAGTGICCVVSLVSIVAGAIMWGVCNDPTAEGCNHAIKLTGQILTYTGVSLIGLGLICCCCCGCCIACLALSQKNQENAFERV